MLLLLLLLLYNMYVSCHKHFFPLLLLNQRWSPPLRLQASHCSTFRIMCDVPSIAVSCSESIECFPGIVSKFFFKLLVTIPVAPIITGTIVHLRFHIRCISIHKLLYFNFFSASSCTTFLSAGIATSISMHVFSFLFLIIISDLFAVTSLIIIIIINTTPIIAITTTIPLFDTHLYGVKRVYFNYTQQCTQLYLL